MSVALASVQGRAVRRGAPASSVGLRARGAGGAVCMEVLATGPAAPRIQPEDRLSGAGKQPARAPAPLVAQLPKPREGVRRPDAASPDLCRDDATVPEGPGYAVPGPGARARHGGTCHRMPRAFG